MTKTYVVKRGPVQPPFSLYGRRAALRAGETLDSTENPWLRGCVRDGRMALVTGDEPEKGNDNG